MKKKILLMFVIYMFTNLMFNKNSYSMSLSEKSLSWTINQVEKTKTEIATKLEEIGLPEDKIVFYWLVSKGLTDIVLEESQIRECKNAIGNFLKKIKNSIRKLYDAAWVMGEECVQEYIKQKIKSVKNKLFDLLFLNVLLDSVDYRLGPKMFEILDEVKKLKIDYRRNEEGLLDLILEELNSVINICCLITKEATSGEESPELEYI